MDEFTEVQTSQAGAGESAPPEQTQQTGTSGAEPVSPEPTNEEKTETTGAEPVSGAEKRIKQVIARQREAEREADYWRGVAEGRAKEEAHPATTPSAQAPTIEQFDDIADYYVARAKYEVLQELKAKEFQEKQNEVIQAHKSRLDKAREKYEDFDTVALRKDLPFTSDIVTAVIESPISADIQYYLCSHPEEVARIVALSPHSQVREIGRLEARFLTENQGTGVKPPKKITGAPPPVETVTGQGSVILDDSVLSPEEWSAKRNRELHKK